MIKRFDSYAEAIPDAEDRVLFAEAVKAAKAGVLRGAYVLVWLSCAESLKRRFRAVRSRDATAKRVAGEIERMEVAHKAIDMFVLNKSKEFGFVDDAGFARLKHIYEMRCLYGHPYERQPREEDLISAAAAVTELVLSQPVRLRHGYLTEQVRLLTQERAFLDDVRASVTEYAQEVSGRMDMNLLDWFLEKLWTSAQPLVADKSMAVFVRRVAWFCGELLATAPPEVTKRWDMASAVTASPVIGAFSLADARVFGTVSRHVQDMVVGNIVERAKKDSRSLRRLQRLAVAGALSERQQKRFQEAVDSLPLKAMAEAGIKLDYYVHRIIEDLKSHNWYVQNPAIEVLNNAGAEAIGGLDEALQEELGNNVLQSAEGNAGSARSFIAEVAADKTQWPVAFIRGLLAECFVNDDDDVRFKRAKADDAMLALRRVPPKARREIVQAISERIAQGKPKEDYRLMRARKEMIELIDDVLAKEPDALRSLSVLRSAVEAIELPKEERDE